MHRTPDVIGLFMRLFHFTKAHSHSATANTSAKIFLDLKRNIVVKYPHSFIPYFATDQCENYLWNLLKDQFSVRIHYSFLWTNPWSLIYFRLQSIRVINTDLVHDNGVHESLSVLLEIILDLITDVFSFFKLLKILPQQVVILDRDKRAWNTRVRLFEDRPEE